MDLVKGTTHAGPSYAQLSAALYKKPVEFTEVESGQPTDRMVSATILKLDDKLPNGMFNLKVRTHDGDVLHLMGYDPATPGDKAPYAYKQV